MKLSKREEDVVKIVGRGIGNKSAARELGITHNCVRNHLHSIFVKLNLRNRTQLALWASARIGEHDHDAYDR